MHKFFNEKITSRDISKFLNDTTKTQISAGSGLLLIKTTSNSATWQYKYVLNGKKYVYSIGPYNKIKLPEAQATHKKLWSDVANGVNVAIEKQNNKNNQNNKNVEKIFTLKDLAIFYINNAESLKDDKSSVAQTISLIERTFIRAENNLFEKPFIIDTNGKEAKISNFILKPANDITQIEIKNFVENIKKRTTKNKVADLLLRIYNLANMYNQDTKIDKKPTEILKTSQVKLPKLQKRDRLVSDTELKELFKLLNNSKNKTLATATKLLFMLGVRKNELLKATWSEFDLNNAVWTLPAERCKNKKSIKIPLSQPALNLLKPLLEQDGNFLFCSFTKDNAPVDASTLNIYINNLIKNNSIIKDKIVPHDTRRYVRSTLIKILKDVGNVDREFIAERCLNHSLKIDGVDSSNLQHYALHDFFDERKNALEKLADYITSITNE